MTNPIQTFLLMDLLLSSLPVIPFLLVLLFRLFLILKPKQTSQRWPLPPGPKSLPIIGSAHRFIGRDPPHQTLRRLSATYGPIMFLHLGEIPFVIVSSADAARQVMITSKSSHNGAGNFDARPINTAGSVLTYGCKGLIISPYGEYWRRIRNLCINELLSPKSVRSFASVRAEELLRLLRSVADDRSIDRHKIEHFTNDAMIRSFLGDGFNVDHRLFLSSIVEVMEVASGFNLAELFPSVPFISTLTGFSNKLKRCHDNLDRILTSILQEHKEKQQHRTGGVADCRYMMDFLLKIQRDESFQPPLSHDHVKAVFTDLLVAAIDTTSTALEWAMAELSRNPTVMRKAQAEVREVLEKKIETEPHEMLGSCQSSYIQFVIRETLRLHPPAPLLLPRESMETCEILGYEIPAKTSVLVNAWAMGRDPKYWTEPESFRPERFMEEEAGVNLKGGHFELIPFGAGKRMCPGMHLGLVSLEETLTGLLCYFDWEVEEENIVQDMTEAIGLTAKKRIPLRLRAFPHIALPSQE